MSHAPPLWSYVPLSDRRPPPRPVRHRLHAGVNDILNHLRRGGNTPAQPIPVEPSPHGPHVELTPGIDWSPAAAALNAVLGPQLAAPVLVVGEPHDGRHQVLERVAAARGWPVAPPPPGAFQTGGFEGVGTGAEGDPWVLPDLEARFLRRPDGLASIRKFLSAWAGGGLGPGLVGCDRWAWSFLATAWGGTPPRTLTLDALDATGAARWLGETAAWGGGVPVRFVDAGNGATVIAGTSLGESPFLGHLTAHARGVPGVIWALWRHALAEQTATATYSVRPWSEVRLPGGPGAWERDDGILLQQILLHGGLPTDTLVDLTPAPRHWTSGRLEALGGVGVLEHDRERWCVSALAYPGVVEHLTSSNQLAR